MLNAIKDIKSVNEQKPQTRILSDHCILYFDIPIIEKYHHRGQVDQAFQPYALNGIETLYDENSCQNFLLISSVVKTNVRRSDTLSITSRMIFVIICL